MSQSDKSALYKELKEAGVEFTKHYREYSTEELAAGVAKLREAQAEHAAQRETPPEPDPLPLDDAPPPSFFGLEDPAPAPSENLGRAQAEIDAQLAAAAQRPVPTPPPAPPVMERNPDEMAGERLNAQSLDEPIRTDELGRVWFQEEVLKPAFPKPRGRRVLQYTDTGTKKATVKAGDFTETFEIAGDRAIASEIKITLPSYQVGIYKDPRFPFRVHTYNGNQGFDLFEVQDYYGGAELVPAEIKRMYVENVLCYDIRTTVRAIQTEFRQLQLAGKVK